MQTRQKSSPHTLAELRERQEMAHLVRLENEAALERAEAQAQAEKDREPVPLAMLPEEELQAITTLEFTPTHLPDSSSSVSFAEVGGTAFFVLVMIGLVVLAKRL